MRTGLRSADQWHPNRSYPNRWYPAPVNRILHGDNLALLPTLPAVQAAARDAGALGCSFSGSGPSVFAWARDEDADAVEEAMRWAFLDAGLAVRAYRAALDSPGARLESLAETVG